MARTDAFGDDASDFSGRHGHEDLVAKGTTGHWINETKGERLRDFVNLFFEIVGSDLDRTGNPRRQFLVPRQEDAILRTDALDEESIGTGLWIGRVVPHEPKPACKAPEHVVAQELHFSTVYSISTPWPRRSIRSK